MLFAIGDLHLSFSCNKPMSVFGAAWENHAQKIKQNWENEVTDNDTVIIPGDISWAMKYNDAAADLEFIDKLPGNKILLPGNHDFWWGSALKLNSMFKSMTFIKNSFTETEGIAICGGRGWLCPNDTAFTQHDRKIYNRELNRIETSLKMAKAKNYENILLALHFPPTNDKKEASGFTELIRKYNVRHVVYAHLHGKYKFNASLTGKTDECLYELVSADYLRFKPMRILY